jgi:hypothetical protein
MQRALLSVAGFCVPFATAGSGIGAAGSTSCTHVAAGTLIPLELVSPISSETARVGDAVALKVAAALVCGGRIVIPAGVPALAEVTHAEPAGRWGQAGELTVNARHLAFDGQRHPLRGLRLGGTAGARSLSTARQMFAPQSGGHDLVFGLGLRTEARLVADVPVPAAASTYPEAVAP